MDAERRTLIAFPIPAARRKRKPQPSSNTIQHRLPKPAASMSDLSAGFSEPPRRSKVSKFKWVAIIGVPLAAILFQVYVPRFFTYLAYLEMPLLVTVYFR